MPTGTIKIWFEDKNYGLFRPPIADLTPSCMATSVEMCSPAKGCGSNTRLQ